MLMPFKEDLTYILQSATLAYGETVHCCLGEKHVCSRVSQEQFRQFIVKQYYHVLENS